MKNLPSYFQAAIDAYNNNPENVTKPLRHWQREAIDKIAQMQNIMLCDATCGSGKSTVQVLHIVAEMERLEQERKHGVFMIASPRLFLNEQLYNGLTKKIDNFNKRVKVFNFSSGELTSDGSDVLHLHDVKFDGNGHGSLSNMLKTQHVLIVACFCSLNTDLDKANNKAETQLSKLFPTRIATQEKAFDLVIIDECHKGFKKKTLDDIKNNTRYLTLYSATPTKTIEQNCVGDVRISYGFRRALIDRVVVKPWLYTVKSVKNNKTAITAAIKKDVIVNSMDHLLKAENIGSRPVLCVFDNTVDHLNDYRDAVKTKYGDEIDIAVYASDKYLAVKNTQGVKVGSKHICLNFNGEKVEYKKTMCDLQEKSTKPLLILSAYMLQEGIDMPYVNGIVILGEKTDANLYQAICRGDRTNNGKTHFNVYVPTYLLNGTHDFLDKLCNGFENQLDFSCGEEKALGQNEASEPVDLTTLPEASVSPMSKNYKKMIVELIKEYENEHEYDITVNNLLDDAKAVLDNGGTRGEAIACIAKYVDYYNEKMCDMLMDFVNTYCKND